MIKDRYDGAIAAWKTGPRPTAEWVTSTVESALVKRPESRGAILHSDHGSQYTSNAYRQCLQRHGLQISMGRVRTCADNASAESVFGQLKRELVRRCQFRTRQEATEKINHYFLNLYNRRRLPPLLSKKPNVIQTGNSRQQIAFVDQKVTKKCPSNPTQSPDLKDRSHSLGRDERVLKVRLAVRQ